MTSKARAAVFTNPDMKGVDPGPLDIAPDMSAKRQRFALRLERRPWTLNVERQGNRWKRAALVKEWRAAFAALAAAEKVPAMAAITVEARPELRHRGSMPDTGACIGAAKAAIDGLVDAGVIPDDGPEFVRYLGFERPIVTGVDALVIEVIEVTEVAP